MLARSISTAFRTPFRGAAAAVTRRPAPLVQLPCRQFSATAGAGDSAAAAVSAPSPPAATAGDMADAASTSSDAVVAALAWSPSDMVVRAIEHTHLILDVPYWGAIAAFTVMLRLLLAPIGVGAVRNGARMAIVRPEVDKLQKAMKADPRANDSGVAQRYQTEIKAVFTKYKVNPLKSLVGPLVQLPVFASVFFGINKFGDYFPEGFSQGGLLWFTDLSVADPLHVLPVLNAMSFLAMIEIGADGMPAEQQGMFKWVMRGLSLFMIPFTLHLPTGLYVYWTTNNIISVTQTLGLRTAPMKKIFDIPDMPKPSEQPALKANAAFNPITAFINKLKEENAHPENAPATIVDGSAPAAAVRTSTAATGEAAGSKAAAVKTFTQPPVRLRKQQGRSKK